MLPYTAGDVDTLTLPICGVLLSDESPVLKTDKNGANLRANWAQRGAVRTHNRSERASLSPVFRPAAIARRASVRCNRVWPGVAPAAAAAVQCSSSSKDSAGERAARQTVRRRWKSSTAPLRLPVCIPRARGKPESGSFTAAGGTAELALHRQQC